ncbi:MAG TPA: hypothetical protein VFQ80_11920 [Thermomicrobiales bacterium]|nr:hypothetical protein [Thermomicrobiales bacterium]
MAAALPFFNRLYLSTDRRFADVVDKVIKPTEATEDEQRYLVGAAFALGLIRRSEPRSGANGHVAYGGKQFDSMPALYRAVKDDEALRAALVREFNLAIDDIPEAQRSGEIQDARAHARKQFQAAIADQQGDDKRFWQAVERAIDHRLRYGQYDVDA